MVTTTPKLSFIRLKTLDPECRCCGKGNSYLCPSCDSKLHSGYAVIIELKDSSTEVRKKPTGYNIMFKADQIIGGEPGIYFVKQTDLKDFLKDGYNNYRATGATKHRGKFLNPKQLQLRTDNNANQQSTAGLRSPMDLRHG